ncbi:MAG: hypothetical protein HQL13_04205 [Candidatus Omnitrophica bacterium]|nr:hypothetical protein [Candidatus Omnitrophota bacterium]
MVKENNQKNPLGKLLKDISYKTGVLCKKVVGLGKVVEKKPWKSVVVATQDICEEVGEKAEVALDKVTKTVEKSTREIRESFKAGMESVKDKQQGVIDVTVLGKKEADLKGKAKTKSPVRKTVTKKKIVKKTPVNLDLEKEIENVTKDVGQV